MAGYAQEPDDVSLLSVLNAILRHRGLVIGTAVAAFLLVVGLVLAQPRTYSTTAKFMTQARGSQSNLSGVAAQFGLTLPTAEAGQSPQFYVDLATSREILRDVAATRFTFQTDTGLAVATLADLYGEPEDAPALRREQAIEELARDVEAETAGATGVIRLTVRAENASLAQQIVQRILQLLAEFNLQRRQSQAAAEREFTEARLTEAQRELRFAENRMEAFLARNRAFGNSPELTFEKDRLARDVSMRQQLFTTLAQAFEQAKIDEVRDTPVITVLGEPEKPLRPDRRGLLRKGLLALAVGLILGVLLALARDFMSRSGGAESEEFAEFSTLKRDALGDLKRPWRLVARMFSRSSAARRPGRA